MMMSKKMDAGDIISQEKIPIEDSDNAGTLHDKLSILGRNLILKVLPQIISNNITLTKQNESEATYGYNITREDEHVDFSESNREIVNKIRGLNPWPGAYSILNGRIVKLWNSKKGLNINMNAVNGEVIALYDDGIGIKCENGEVIITELQLEGRKRMSASEFMNGAVNKELLVGRIFE